MQFRDGKLLFSASDLVNFLGCRHATYLDLRNLADQVAIPERDAATVLIFEKGMRVCCSPRTVASNPLWVHHCR
jgi:hypothetical protein